MDRVGNTIVPLGDSSRYSSWHVLGYSSGVVEAAAAGRARRLRIDRRTGTRIGDPGLRLLGRLRRPRLGAVVVGLLLLAGLWMGVSGVEGSGSAVSPGVGRAEAPGDATTAVPTSLATAASALIGAQARNFRVSSSRETLSASGGGVSSSFARSGVSLRTADGVTRMSLVGVGYGARPAAVAEVAPTANGNSVSYRRDSLREWYRNGPVGLEQGFTLARRPAGRAFGPLTLALRVGGSMVVRRSGSGVVFTPADGPAVLRYGALSVHDARGRSLPLEIVPRRRGLALRVWDHGARYPLTIDPLIYQDKLIADGKSLFGISVALSSDGNTALIGGSADHHFSGSAWIFIRKGGKWIDEQKLTAPSRGGGKERGAGSFGSAVALSSDGNTALIGGYGDHADVGAAWVFVNKGGKWIDQHKLSAPKCCGGEEYGKASFGVSAALSSSGNTALIGGYGDSGFGATWVFTRRGKNWSFQVKLTPFQAIGANSGFGYSVALSSDGNTALIGGPDDHAYALPPTPSPEGLYPEQYAGAAWVFIRSNNFWDGQQKLAVVGPPAVGVPGDVGQGLGWSAALSSDGNTALIGTSRGAEAAYVFVRKGHSFGHSWTKQQELAPPIAGHNAERGPFRSFFGFSVALSSDGATALMGGPTDGCSSAGECLDLRGVGAAWASSHAGGTWTVPRKLTAPPKGSGTGLARPAFGWSVALSSDGGTALVGGPYNGANSLGNGAWVLGDQPGKR